MTAPSDPEDAAESLLEEQEIVLRLGDILPRVPAHLLKPGPHDPESEIRFSVEELAEKISRGRVSVPLRRLSSVCPTVFRDSSAFPGEQEVPLPLQKLLEQVGLIVPKPPTANGIPSDQFSQARIEAVRIIESKTAADPSPREPAAPADIPNPISKAISTARHLLGLLGLHGDSPQTAAKTPEVTSPPAASTPTETPNPVETSPPPPASPSSTQATPEGCISVRLLPIFRLLSPPVLRTGVIPSDEACVVLPLSVIDPQLAAGHVEIPVEDFVKGLPEDLRDMIDPIPGNQIWIPLDEIFQNLPKTHLFYMPPFDPLAYSAAAPVEDLPPAEPAPEPKETAPAATEPEKEAEPAPEIADKSEALPPAETAQEPAQDEETAPVAEPAPPPSSAVEASPAEPPSPPVEPVRVEPTHVEPVAAPAPAEPPPSRAPWMRGFQVPPPRLFAITAAPTETLEPPAPTEPPPAPSPSTPEARRTADFLTTQTGIFAAAAFVEGAVFASADFPRKPDLDALREFMGFFIDQARDSAHRLGWNRVLTIPCEQFHLTAVVRDTHFIVALHHDRVLTPLTYDTLIAAADELGKGSGF